MLVPPAFVPGEDARGEQGRVAMSILGADNSRDWDEVTCRDALVGIVLRSRRLRAVRDGPRHLSRTGGTVRLHRGEVFTEGLRDISSS